MDPEVEKILKISDTRAEFSESEKFIVLTHTNSCRPGAIAVLLNQVEELEKYGYRLLGSVQIDYMFTYATLVKNDG